MDGRLPRGSDVLLGFPSGREPTRAPRRRVRAAPRRARHDPRAGGRGDLPLDPGEAMSCDFTLEHYAELLDAARSGGYRFAHFDRAPQGGDLLLRHDVDLSLD